MSDSLYQLLADQLDALGSPIFPAETHGTLCGMICLTNKPDIELWYSLIIDEKQQQSPKNLHQLITLLGQLRVETETAFAANSGGVDLLMPDDEAPLQGRVTAITQWCDGLLYGLGVGGMSDERQLPDHAREFISDVRDISQLDPATLHDEAEHDLMEIIEYLRVGVLVLREEILPDATINALNPNQTKH